MLVCYDYLLNSRWIFSGFFNWIAETPAILKMVDLLNVWGLVFIGLALLFGVFTRVAAILGMTLLAFYYLATVIGATIMFSPVETSGQDHALTSRRFQGIPSLAISPGGRLWSFWALTKVRPSVFGAHAMCPRMSETTTST